MTAATPEPPSATLLRDVAAYADSRLQHRRRTLRIPGIAAAIASRGLLLLETAHGVADAASGEALSPRHLFRIASHSKTFTATAVLQLMEAGRLSLGDRLGEHLPWVAAAPGSTPLADVTVEELLSHSGGVVRDGTDGDHWQLRRPFPDAPGLRGLVEQGSQAMAPNTRFHYSNVGYALLGLVIEAVTGLAYAECVRAHILEPLDLSNTATDYVPERAHEYAAGHAHAGEGASRIPVDHVRRARWRRPPGSPARSVTSPGTSRRTPSATPASSATPPSGACSGCSGPSTRTSTTAWGCSCSTGPRGA